MARPVIDFLSHGVPEAARSALLVNRAWVSGRWVQADGGNSFPVSNPSAGAMIAEVRQSPCSLVAAAYYSAPSMLQAPDMGREETKEAIQSAYNAQKQWALLPAKVFSWKKLPAAYELSMYLLCV